MASSLGLSRRCRSGGQVHDVQDGRDRPGHDQPGIATSLPLLPIYLIRVRSSPPQIPSQQPSILMLDGPFSIRFPE